MGRIQQWYRIRRDGDWEHAHGVEIATLHNPGWSLTIGLVETGAEQALLFPIAHRVGENTEPKDKGWYVCTAQDSQFKGIGGPDHLKTA